MRENTTERCGTQTNAAPCEVGPRDRVKSSHGSQPPSSSRALPRQSECGKAAPPPPPCPLQRTGGGLLMAGCGAESRTTPAAYRSGAAPDRRQEPPTLWRLARQGGCAAGAVAMHADCFFTGGLFAASSRQAANVGSVCGRFSKTKKELPEPTSPFPGELLGVGLRMPRPRVFF